MAALSYNLFARQWAWHYTLKIIYVCSRNTTTFIPNLVSLHLTIPEFYVFIQTDRHVSSDAALLVILIRNIYASSCLPNLLLPVIYFLAIVILPFKDHYQWSKVIRCFL